jgi:predicted DNA-binding protein
MLDDMAPKKDAAEAVPSTIRLPTALHERLARVREAMSKRVLTELPSAVAVKAALERGLDALEGELGIKRSK